MDTDMSEEDFCDAVEATNSPAAKLIERLERERDRYKIALEGIAGFPHQYFDEETPWRMRKLAEHALIHNEQEKP